MKKFKVIDFWISAGLIIASAIIGILEGFEDFLSNYFLMGYFVVGAWQVISMLVHAFYKCFTKRGGARYIYHWITFISVVTMPGSFWVLLYIAPFMAVYYAGLCYAEVRKMNQRPLDLLK